MYKIFLCICVLAQTKYQINQLSYKYMLRSWLHIAIKSNEAYKWRVCNYWNLVIYKNVEYKLLRSKISFTSKCMCAVCIFLKLFLDYKMRVGIPLAYLGFSVIIFKVGFASHFF